MKVSGLSFDQGGWFDVYVVPLSDNRTDPGVN